MLALQTAKHAGACWCGPALSRITLLRALTLTPSMMPLWSLIIQRDAPPRFHTIMGDALQDCDDDDDRINRFSNPDKNYGRMVTGDDDHNNAKSISDNMVRSLKSAPPVSLFALAEQLNT